MPEERPARDEPSEAPKVVGSGGAATDEAIAAGAGSYVARRDQKINQRIDESDRRVSFELFINNSANSAEAGMQPAPSLPNESTVTELQEYKARLGCFIDVYAGLRKVETQWESVSGGLKRSRPKMPAIKADLDLISGCLLKECRKLAERGVLSADEFVEGLTRAEILLDILGKLKTGKRPVLDDLRQRVGGMANNLKSFEQECIEGIRDELAKLDDCLDRLRLPASGGETVVVKQAAASPPVVQEGLSSAERPKVVVDLAQAKLEKGEDDG